MPASEPVKDRSPKRTLLPLRTCRLGQEVEFASYGTEQEPDHEYECPQAWQSLENLNNDFSDTHSFLLRRSPGKAS